MTEVLAVLGFTLTIGFVLLVGNWMRDVRR